MGLLLVSVAYIRQASYSHNFGSWCSIPTSYYCYLQEKPTLDYSGVDTYVAACLQRGDMEWLPINKALTLQETDRHELSVQEQLRQLRSQMDKMHELLQRHLREPPAPKTPPRTRRSSLTLTATPS